jgi:regulator of protease activity HflC (stomatin/prohibitin superfamily)
VDFGIDPDRGRLRGTPLEQLGTILTESAQQYAFEYLSQVPLAAALTDGVEEVSRRLDAGLAADRRLAETGVAVVGLRVVAIRPDPEVEKTLQTPTREQLQQGAPSHLRAPRPGRRAGAGDQRERDAEPDRAGPPRGAAGGPAGGQRPPPGRGGGRGHRIQSEAEAAQRRCLGEAQADATRAMGAAAAASEAARLAAYRELSEATLVGLASRIWLPTC